MKSTSVNNPPRLSSVTAVILAGGFGTRLQSVVSDRPKVLAEVAGRPFLEHILLRLKSEGIRRVVICTGYKAEQIEETYKGSFQGIKLSYSRESEPLGTGGALRKALPLLPIGGTVLVMNGDSVAEVALSAFFNFHRDAKSNSSLTLIEVPDGARYGKVTFSLESCLIEEFQEKDGVNSPSWINSGIYLFSTLKLSLLPVTAPLSLEKDVFPEWVKKESLFAFPAPQGAFIDIGTPESYKEAEHLFNSGVFS